MKSFISFAESSPVWKHVGREKAGFISNSGDVAFGDSHYDLAIELGMKGGPDLVLKGVRVTLGHKTPHTTEIGFELMADNSRGMLQVMKMMLDLEPDEAYVDLHKNNVRMNDYESYGSHNYQDVVSWVKQKRSELIKSKP